VILFVSGCEDEYVAPFEPVDVSWYTSEAPTNDYVIAQGDFISFIDVSQGTLSHEWILSDGVGQARFITGDVYGMDEDSLHLKLFIFCLQVRG